MSKRKREKIDSNKFYKHRKYTFYQKKSKKGFYANNYSNAVLFTDKNKTKDFFSIICYECDKKKYYANNYLKKKQNSNFISVNVIKNLKKKRLVEATTSGQKKVIKKSIFIKKKLIIINTLLK
jgi:hypothetical protein